jgi:general stress protein YciG
MSTAETPKRPRGFAAIDPALVSEIARKGGKAAHAAGTAHEFTVDEARAAGRKGGLSSAAKKKAAKEAASLPEDEKTTIRP